MGLFHQRPYEAQSVGVAPGAGDFVGVPFGGAPVEGFASVDDVVECADGFFDGGVAVGAVGVDEVDVGELEAGEGGVDAFDDVFAGEAAVVDGVFAVRCAPVDLWGVSC